ncbi:Prophage integrase IntA [Cupriavidus yeoncheonensis]|uniref:Prophage integrase IntA n=1 Tax=Cupriavidus yeoncheonensis TaxID=1462994 RepID=A0A916IT81_9BURK|nr:site-specific integrase [Cupriavidus yeoncheonensis]CAG2144236.1 Prophage integrase IntA [Cupriavidus yeoncheonensis]
MPALTELALKALKAEADGQTLRDGGNLTGKVRVKVSGAVSVSFVYTYKRDGKFRDLSCGTWPSVSLKSIRLARDAARSLLEQGVDPAERKRVNKLEARAEEQAKIAQLQQHLARPTLRAVYQQWVTAELSNRKDQGAETKRGIEKDVIPVLGDRHADDIKRADIMAVLDKVKARGANRLANRLLAELRQLFSFALVREIVTGNPTIGIEKKHVGGAEVERDRVLTESELRALRSALEAANLPDSTKAALWLQLATACRIGEIIKARRADIDLDAATWVIPSEHSKNGKPNVVHLSAFALGHMWTLVALSGSSAWLMPASKGDRHADLKGITKQVSDRQLKYYDRTTPHSKRTATHRNALALGASRWTPHDLRRTAATLMQACGILPAIIEKCLNHTDENRIRRTYQVHDYRDEKRQAWDLLGQRLASLSSNNVVVLTALTASH